MAGSASRLRKACGMVERTRTVTWEDPKAAGQAGRRMAGINDLCGMADRTMPALPALLLLGAGVGTIEPARVTIPLEPGKPSYHPLGSVHGA